MNVNPRIRRHGDDHAALPASGSTLFSEMAGTLEGMCQELLAEAAELSRQIIATTPRRYRPERREWYRNAVEIDADGLPYDDRFTARPYLVAHPGREIAAPYGRSFYCDACKYGDIAAATMTNGEANGYIIAAAHRHNATYHPRRWARSQHLSGAVALDEARRVTTWGADA